MAATFEWSESNLVGEVEAIPIANLNFGSVDDYELNTTTYPITRGNASFEKYIRCKFTGVFTEISNMKFWKSAGAYVAGESCKTAANVVYAQPSATPNADSDVPITEGSALHIHSAEGLDTIEYGASGVSGYTDYIRLQLRTTSPTTPSGAVNQKTMTFQYDEV
jgi:hypothetical protein